MERFKAFLDSMSARSFIAFVVVIGLGTAAFFKHGGPGSSLNYYYIFLIVVQALITGRSLVEDFKKATTP